MKLSNSSDMQNNALMHHEALKGFKHYMFLCYHCPLAVYNGSSAGFSVV